MDQTVLHFLVRELAESERFRAFLEELPDTRARVSEPALPLLLAALYQELDCPLVLLAPEDADARDAAEAAAWFLGDERVAFLPSRGVGWGSGLEPPPHLVGERARALDVLAAGGLVSASAVALAEGMPPPEARPEPIRVAPGEAPGIDLLAEQLALAGYERVEQAQERGQFALRGGIVDVYPTTGREPFRIELFGDEIEGIRAFSPFTQRTLHPVRAATIYPGAERRLDLLEAAAQRPVRESGPGEGARGNREVPPGEHEAAAIPNDLSPPVAGGPDFVWRPDEVRAVWAEEQIDGVPIDEATELDWLPSGQSFAFEAQRPASAARGLAEAETELRAFVRGGLRTVVAFAHRGEALRTENLLRRVEARVIEPGEQLPAEAELLFAVSPARRGFVWRELGLALLPDMQVFRRRVPRRTAPAGRALQSFADLRTGDHVVHEDHGVGKLLGFETREVAGVTRDYLLLAYRGEDRLYVPHEQIGKVSRYIGVDGKAPTLSKLGGRAWHLLKSRARASIRELAGELLRLYAQRQSAPGLAY